MLIWDAAGRPRYLLASDADVTELRKAEAERRIAATVFEATDNAILVTDDGGRILSVNRAFSSQTGLKAAQVVGQPVDALAAARTAGWLASVREHLAQGRHVKAHGWLRREPAGDYPVWLSASPVKRNGARHEVFIVVDTGVQRAQSERIDRLLHYDQQTRLPNRNLFTDRLAVALEHARRHGERLAVLLLGLERMGEINAAHGHETGNQVIVEAAARFRAAPRQEETLARLESDDFALFATIDGSAAAAAIAVRIGRLDCAARARRIVEAAGLAPGLFELEITESAALQHSEQTDQAILALKAAGFGLAVDDFGTGFSSLTYLQRYPLDKVKIDLSFVRDMHHDARARAIVLATLAMARGIGICALAEGVETEEQLASLRELGCDLGQGLPLRPPPPAARFAKKWLKPASAHPG